MLITQIDINRLMRQSLTGARLDDPVIPEPAPRPPRRSLRRLLAGQLEQLRHGVPVPRRRRHA
jgi:hypothetical protein